MVEVKQNRDQNTNNDTCYYREIDSEISLFNHDISGESSWKRKFMAVGNEKPQQDAKNARNNKQLAHISVTVLKVRTNSFLLIKI